MAVVDSNRGHMARRLLCAVLLMAAFATAASPRLLAQSAGGERILWYDVAIQVQPDSTMYVEENIHVRAAGDQIKHGVFRDFPTEYRNSRGDRIEVGFQVEKVTRDGQPEPFNVSSVSNGKRVRIGSANVTLAPGEYTYVIAYRTDHQLGFFPDHDELYWNATGFWGFEIDRVTVRVGLPEGVPADQVKLQAYTGPSGATGTDYTADMADGFPHFATTKPLGTYEGITIVVGWPKGFVTVPPPVQHRLPRTLSWDDIRSGDWSTIRVFRDASGIAMATCAIILVVLLGGAWLLFGRDPQGRSIAVSYEPPEHLSPAAIRYVRTRALDAKALTAAVLDLAAKKYVTIRKEESTYAVVRTGNEPDPPLSMDEDVAAQELFKPPDAMAMQTRELMDKKLAELEQKHPTLAHMAEGVLHSMGKPDDANTVYLRRSSPRLLSAFQAAKTQIKHAIPASSLIRTNHWVVGLSVVYAIAGTFVCISRFPGRLADDNWGYAPIAIIFMAFHAFAMGNLGGKISKLLPIESFAGEHSVGSTIGTAIGAVVASAIVVITGWLIALLTSLQWAAAFASMWLAIAIFSRLLQQPTALGERYWEEIEGFRQFLSEVDEDRLNRMNPPTKTPELFERMLPYALALDCELEWAKKFEAVLAMAATAQSGGQVTYSPSWYSGPAGGMLNASAFTDAFASSFSSAIASSTVPPGSSSGFSGGGSSGSSGGGGGGGGGGGW